MGLFERKKHRREDMAMVRRVVDDGVDMPWYHIPPVFWEAVVLIILAILLVLICFWGRPPHLPVLIKDAESKVRFEAPFDFSYTSKYQKDLQIEQARRRTVPVYRVAFEESQVALGSYKEFITKVGEHFDELKLLPKAELVAACNQLIIQSQLPGIPERISDDLARIVDMEPDKENFTRVMKDALSVVEVLLKNGIYERQGDVRIYFDRSVDNYTASRNLRDNLDSIASREFFSLREQSAMTAALVDIFRPGLQPNIQIDDVATQKRQEEAIAKVKDVVVEVKKGDPLTERGMKNTPAVVERWNAFRKQLASHSASGYGFTQALLENILVAFSIMFVAGLYIRVAIPPGPRKRRAMTLTALIVLLNLGLIRLVLDFSESQTVIQTFSGNEFLFWLAPPALAAILVTILVGTHMAVLATLIVCGFSSVMLGRSLDVLLISTLACLIGIYFSRGTRNRSGVVRAGFFSGIAVTIPVFVICVSSEMRWEALLWQTSGCLLSGLLTGMFVVGILPLLENFFKITTDVTLLELTDYNHPLLRKLQLIAPGTFHHSVMVANLAERAALQIDANSLLCRCASLYHDVGKMVKPEYFVENQRPGMNPHEGLSPSMSALIIKSHVREGVEIAKEYSLPRVIIDVIEQHHGTGLIQFFYHKACQKASVESRLPFPATQPGSNPAPTNVSAEGIRSVDERVFRYDGPRPRTKEAAVILFADSVEAASRSLKKVTPQTVEELVDTLITSRIADGQLDLCPLSFREVQRIRASLKFSLTNMLHHRVEYPGEVRPASKSAPAATTGAP
ncbi:MAG: HDIG domain-containing protein [Puniceicoccales bacterium]|jgi:putative nucleotidyltransferase with HDIG domain|nr:HDIG domain-containing protein [Puniceicoccales bacterium]